MALPSEYNCRNNKAIQPFTGWMARNSNQKCNLRKEQKIMLKKIVFINFDDIGQGDFGATSLLGPGPKTPNIDRIARRGAILDFFSTTSTVCSPARYGFMTGRHPAEDGVYTTLLANDTANMVYNNIEGIQANVPTLYSELKKLGFATAHHGKWHMGLDDNMLDHSEYGLDEYSGWAFHNPAFPVDADRLASKDAENWAQNRDQIMLDRIKLFLDSNSESFFVNWSLHTPHWPLNPTDEAMFELSNLADPSDGSVTPAQKYFASIWDADKRIGELVDHLDDLGILDETLIFITGDNGPGTDDLAPTSNEAWGRVNNFRGEKGVTLNGGIMMPTVCAGPGIAAGIRLSNCMLSALDLMPTFITMAGGTPPPNDGEDISNQLKGNDVDRTRPLHWLSVQNKANTTENADRAPLVRGYYPDLGLSAYTNPPGHEIETVEVYETFKNQREINDARTTFKKAIVDNVSDRNDTWYQSLNDPRLRPQAGILVVK